MAFREMRLSTVIYLIIILIGLLFSGFLLLFGVANLVNPDVPDANLKQNTKVCLMVCSLGVGFFVV
jgi:hypothetical protein